jgi:hypothetical protein
LSCFLAVAANEHDGHIVAILTQLGKGLLATPVGHDEVEQNAACVVLVLSEDFDALFSIFGG